MSKQEDFLAQANVAVLATVDAKSRAHAAPIWYLYRNGEIVMSTGRGSQKHKNVEAHPEVTLVVDSRELPYYALMVQGPVEVGPPFSPDERRELATRYLGERLAERYLEVTQGGDSVTLRLRPRKVIEFEGRAGR